MPEILQINVQIDMILQTMDKTKGDHAFLAYRSGFLLWVT